jgi:hypothetical protein
VTGLLVDYERWKSLYYCLIKKMKLFALTGLMPQGVFNFQKEKTP